MSQQIYEINDNISRLRTKMDNIIKTLKSQLEKNSNKDDDEEDEGKKKENDETDLRIKKNLFDAMIKKYENVINRYQNIESNIKSEKEKKLFREAEIVVNHDLNEEERQKLIEDPNYLQDMYKDQLTGQAPVQLQNAVRDLEERHKDIVKLEKSILELHKMVTELNLLVQYQGEMIDNIAENVCRSKEYIQKGEKEVVKSKENLKRARKKKCIVIIVVVIILIIVLAPTLIAIFK